MATRKDVAARAGVSVATVSYVLNNTKPVTEAVRERVLDAVRELDYRPNLVARSLTSNHTRHVALIVDNLQNPYFIDVLTGAQGVALAGGYIISALSAAEEDFEAVYQLIGRGVEGAILTTRDGEVERYLQKHLHCVVDGCSVAIDYRPAVYSMVEELVGLGHREVAFLAGLPLSDSHIRYTALREALAAAGRPLDMDLIVQCGDTCRTDERAGYDAARELLARGKPFTALFAINDMMALGAWRALGEAGLRIPQDVSLIGCDDIPAGRWLYPGLATFGVRSRQVGAYMMQRLIEAIEQISSPARVVEAEYIHRESVGERKER